MLNKILGSNAKLRLSDRPDHIDSSFINGNGVGGDNEYNYISLYVRLLICMVLFQQSCTECER